VKDDEITTRIGKLVPKLFKGVPANAQLLNTIRGVDKITTYWLLPDGKEMVRSQKLSEIKLDPKRHYRSKRDGD